MMGTLVTIQVVRPGAEAAIQGAFEWFRQIEETCTRFNPASELMQLTTQIGKAVPASAILYEAVRFALLVAEESGGAFDPTAGHSSNGDVTYRDVQLDANQRTITLLRPLTLDLGGVAKGLAVDTAARELQPLEDFAIDAGGDLYLGGRNPEGGPWSVGIRHPRLDRELIETLHISNKAVCTSGDYERGQHILNPRTGAPPSSVASATVVAPTAILADALATAVFVLGPAEGMELLDRAGVEGLILTPELKRYETRGLFHAC
jgi:thiamine biosynthesis lipoprotein